MRCIQAERIAENLPFIIVHFAMHVLTAIP